MIIPETTKLLLRGNTKKGRCNLVQRPFSIEEKEN